MRLTLFAAVALLAANFAHADELFTLTSGNTSISFTVPASFTPVLNGNACDPAALAVFCDTSVVVDINGTDPTEDVNFYGSLAGGGLAIAGQVGAKTFLLDQIGTSSTAVRCRCRPLW